ncbi:MAG: TIGR02221 family CRISPR-associated protein [Bacteroidetes bacterium]|nr:TIGR02221 family CRISPR-associated protein [Bacteroidota bacterium]
MVLLSFLGKGDYQEVTYFLQDENKEFKTKFFIQAVNEFFKPTKIILFMTSDAEQKYHSELSSTIKYEKVLIKEGKTIEELWDNFEIISAAVPSEEEIILDITHAFRSIPIIALSVLTFLKILHNIRVKKIIYGAFEAKKEGKAPVFDITSFLDLLEWSYATDEFLNFGNAKRLRKLLDDIHNKTFKSNSDIKSVALKRLGKNLDEITTALSVIRPNEVLKSSIELPKLTENVKYDIENLAEAKPLGKLLTRIPNNFQIIAEAKDLFSEAGFRAQVEMMNFYIKIENYQQAITIARELIVSLLCVTEKLDPIGKDDREKAEDMLNEWLSISKKGILLNHTAQKYSELWSKIVNYRNDINHAGMKKNPTPAQTLISNIKNLCSEISKFMESSTKFS